MKYLNYKMSKKGGNMTFFITGAAGFIGYFLSKRLLNDGHFVISIDSLNDYYSPDLKKERINILSKNKNFVFFNAKLEDEAVMEHIFSKNKIDVVVNLAAQAGVRYSIENPKAYVDSNIVGFLNVLQACRKYEISHLLFASSSSIYGLNNRTPYKEDVICDCPISFYAATKKANELMAYSYSHLYQIPSTALRFFTVYGPFGRPDMAYFKFAEKIANGEKIQVFNNGKLYRDFTYIDDVVEAIIRLIPLPPSSQVLDSDRDGGDAPYKNPYFDVFNIGNEKPVLLTDFIEILEEKLKMKAIKQLVPMQKGDVHTTCASTEKLYKKIGWKPTTPLEEGLAHFAKWFLEYKKTH